jgi:uncharacterized protein with HEPN domain
MFNDEAIVRFQTIIDKIGDIEAIIVRHGAITRALGDFEGQPALLMLLVAIAEQFHKLKKCCYEELICHFDENDIKGIYDIRVFIAHDYEGVNLAIIERVIREKIPQLKAIAEHIVSSVISTLK